MKRMSLRFFLCALVTLGSACGDGPGKLPVGGTCGADEDCAAGLCYEQICLDPAQDDDLDGLINSLEVGLTINPEKSDTDEDGKLDPDELAPDFSALDGDGDGLIDALESVLEDADGDCLADELDADDKRPSSETLARVAEVCPTAGVCGAEGAVLSVLCPDGLTGEARCDFRRVEAYQSDEVSCDGADNDCDGQTDEVCGLVYEGLLGHWRLDSDGADSGPYGDDGVVESATPTTDRFGTPASALRFDDAGDRVTVPATHHPLGDAEFTYTLWVRPDAGARGGILSIGEMLENRRTVLMAEDAGCVAYAQGAQAAVSPFACAPAGHWSFIAVTRKGDTLRFYLDGQLASEATVGALDLRRSSMTLGSLKQLASGATFEPFVGALDDVRLYGRVLLQAELDTLFAEGGWKPAGDPSNPGQSCRHIRDASAAPATGQVVLDVDGDGPAEPFAAYCDQTTDGGGWTLAWVYGFEAPGDFTSAGNAVFPIPSWPATSANVEVSEDAPSDPETHGAIPWSAWAAIGRSFRIENELFGSLACDAADDRAGSLSTGIEGPVTCRWLSGEACALPDWVFFWEFGPGLSADNLFVYFDGSATSNWPTHDACGQNRPPANMPNSPYGAVYLR
jgi:hypothetical protein